MKTILTYRHRFIPMLVLSLLFVSGAIRAIQGSATTITVPAGGDFQAALNSAQPGDTIVLTAGATYTGSFRLPVNTGTSFVTIRTSAPDSSLPPAGTRIDPSYAAALPKILGSAGVAAIYSAPGAHHFQFIGVEIAPTAGTFLYSAVLLGDGSDTSASTLPHDIVFDRTYIHGDPTAGSRRGIAANGANISVINSYLNDFKDPNTDAQAIMCWNGTGPLLIQNNFLEGAGENVMIGGQDPKILNLVPSDITVKGNYLYKRPSWKGSPWVVKNLFELKNANNVVVDGNVLENVWAAAQTGFAVLFTTRDQDGTAPWTIVSNVKFTNNIIKHAGSGVSILGIDSTYPSAQGHDYLVDNNLFIDISSVNWAGPGRFV